MFGECGATDHFVRVKHQVLEQRILTRRQDQRLTATTAAASACVEFDRARAED